MVCNMRLCSSLLKPLFPAGGHNGLQPAALQVLLKGAVPLTDTRGCNRWTRIILLEDALMLEGAMVCDKRL